MTLQQVAADSRQRIEQDIQQHVVVRSAALAMAFNALLTLGGCFEGRGGGKANAAEPAASASAAGRVVALARGIVDLPGGLVDITTPLDGQVQQLLVREGDTVKAGQPLLRLAPDQQQRDLALAQAELQLAQARQRAQQARLPAVTRQAQRLADALRAEAVEAQRADEAQQTQRDLEAAIGVAQAETALAQQKLTQVQQLARRLTVNAPLDASVLRLQVQPGTQVSLQSGKPLLTLLPARALRVRAELNEAFAGKVRVGMPARVWLDNGTSNGTGTGNAALPTARVVRISPLFSASRLDDDAQMRGNVRVVDCFLEFDQAPGLRIGQTVRVEFHE